MRSHVTDGPRRQPAFLISSSTRKLKATLILAVICFGLATAGQAAAESIFLGVIEKSDTHYVGEVSTTPFMVRAAFQWKENKWQAFPCKLLSREDLKKNIIQFPERVAWSIGLHGQNRGQFHTTRPSEWTYYSDIGLLQPDPSELVRLIPNKPGDFEYWGGSWRYRPLVVASKPNFADPEHWKETNIPGDAVRPLIPFFRTEVKSVSLTCDGKQTTTYSDHLILARKSYVSVKGNRLVQLALDNSAVKNCDGPPEDAYDSRWYYIEGNTIRFLGQSLELIDAGDYDKDGHSEIVFHKTGYDLDGYVLFYDQLKQKAEFSWIYH